MPQPKTWSPTLTQRQAFSIRQKKRYKLYHGPKMSGKTRGVLHEIAEHMWMEDRPIVGMFAKSIKSAAISGSYNELTSIVLPEWFAGPLGFKFTVEPKIDGATRTHHFRTNNRHGTESSLYLFSIDTVSEIDAKVKNLVFSMMYVIELSNFGNSPAAKNMFFALIQQLRQSTVPPENRRWIADTNPADEGEDSWIWQNLISKETLLKDPETKPLTDQLVDIQFTVDDNPLLPKLDRDLLYASLCTDADLKARFWDGKWVRDVRSGIYHGHYDPDLHVLPQERDQVLLPSENCTELLTGWDTGDKFHSFHLLEKIFDPESNWSLYVVLDELFTVDEEVGITDFAEAAYESMKRYSKWVKDEYKREIIFRDWSDSAALNNYRAASDSYDANLIKKATGGVVRVMAAPKGAGSVKRGIILIKRLLAEKRLIISRNCIRTQQMFVNLRKPKNGIKDVVHDEYSHIHDSLRYILSSEEPVDTIRHTESNQGESKLVVAEAGWRV